MASACDCACRFLLIFGGGSVAHCHNDLWCLDTYTLQWSQPPTAGTPPCPRAGAVFCMPLLSCTGKLYIYKQESRPGVRCRFGMGALRCRQDAC